MRMVSCASISGFWGVSLGPFGCLVVGAIVHSCRPACVGMLQLLWNSDLLGGVMGSTYFRQAAWRVVRYSAVE